MRRNVILYNFNVLVGLITICVSYRACSTLTSYSIAILMLRLLLLRASDSVLACLVLATWLATHEATGWLYQPIFLLIVTQLSALSLSGQSNLFLALWFESFSNFLLSNNICLKLSRNWVTKFLIRSVLFTYDLLIGTWHSNFLLFRNFRLNVN